MNKVILACLLLAGCADIPQQCNAPVYIDEMPEIEPEFQQQNNQPVETIKKWWVSL